MTRTTSQRHVPAGTDGRSSIDQEELARFSEIADAWWDPDGPFRPLHQLNPVRLNYLRTQLDQHFKREPSHLRPYEGLSVLDVGCGGGLLSEPLARLGAQVTSIDADAEAISVASHHARTMGLAIDYRCTSAEEVAESNETFDIIIAMEIIEHVSNLGLFSEALGRLAKPGAALALATLNRTFKSFALAIVGAEYIMRWLPRGTHSWEKFVRPSEASRHLRRHGFAVTDVSGVSLDPLAAEWRLSRNTSVNYVMFATKSQLP